MEPQRHRNGQEHDAAIASVALYLHEEMGIEDREAREKASEVVREARESVAHHVATVSSWSLGLRGLLALVAGVIFLQRPIETVAALVLILGAWILVDGVIALVSAISNREWAGVPYGAISVLVGYLIFTRPQGAMTAFFILAAAWALARGASEITQAARMHKGEKGRGSLVFLGIVSFAFGLLLIASPVLGLVTLGWWLGIYAVTEGVVSIVRAFQLRRVSRDVQQVWTGRGRAVQAG